MNEQSIQPNSPDTSRVVNRTALWVIFSMATGFLLPICACGFLCLMTGVAFNGFWKNALDSDQESGPAIGIIDLSGVIYDGPGVGATKENLRDQIEWMVENNDVKAIVIQANSPGGDANASDEIWQLLTTVEKPVVISVQGLCASGCLYIASGGDEIMATRNSLVGSIGVISTFFNAEELLDKIGVEPNVVATGKNKDFGSIFREMTPEEEAFWRDQLAVVLDNFIQVVANRPGSTLSEAQVRDLATGQVWAADIARQNGLVDSIGYKEDALERAASLAGISDYRVVEYPYSFSQFFNIFASASPLGSEGYFALPDTSDVLDSLQQPTIQYRYLGPYSSASSH